VISRARRLARKASRFRSSGPALGGAFTDRRKARHSADKGAHSLSDACEARGLKHDS